LNLSRLAPFFKRASTSPIPDLGKEAIQFLTDFINPAFKLLSSELINPSVWGYTSAKVKFFFHKK
jgi:hypothetical protein